MDARGDTPYLNDAMLRRLITLLALLTGLAAAGAPAHAVIYNEASGVELAAKAEKARKGDACECSRVNRQSFDTIRAKKPCKPAPVITVVIPTVQFGVDRSYE
ncbi:hypothetical protein [Qipengyuania qiaonensis]|uniref:Uncharacterized protein n=1 Tax=Qipengyuania qiaonensis TaxID=2867240 RepID=A0ABS7JBY6_9SPHN|nr:hypothetical protein [Qipengyuania qiaonensis]MBX7483574.1 hypothetical protein [Qipengyuania qiaonensis]